MSLLFVIVIAPVLFFLFIWVAVTTYRLYFPERAASFEHRRAARWQRQKEMLGEEAPVGLREIRENQRRYFREHVEASYHYAGGGGSGGFPSDWMEDLWRRRN